MNWINGTNDMLHVYLMLEQFWDERHSIIDLFKVVLYSRSHTCRDKGISKPQILEAAFVAMPSQFDILSFKSKISFEHCCVQTRASENTLEWWHGRTYTYDECDLVN